jgi:hypothetical protein
VAGGERDHARPVYPGVEPTVVHMAIPTLDERAAVFVAAAAVRPPLSRNLLARTITAAEDAVRGELAMTGSAMAPVLVLARSGTRAQPTHAHCIVLEPLIEPDDLATTLNEVVPELVATGGAQVAVLSLLVRASTDSQLPDGIHVVCEPDGEDSHEQLYLLGADGSGAVGAARAAVRILPHGEREAAEFARLYGEELVGSLVPASLCSAVRWTAQHRSPN